MSSDSRRKLIITTFEINDQQLFSCTHYHRVWDEWKLNSKLTRSTNHSNFWHSRGQDSWGAIHRVDWGLLESERAPVERTEDPSINNINASFEEITWATTIKQMFVESKSSKSMRAKTRHYKIVYIKINTFLNQTWATRHTMKCRRIRATRQTMLRRRT